MLNINKSIKDLNLFNSNLVLTPNTSSICKIYGNYNIFKSNINVDFFQIFICIDNKTNVIDVKIKEDGNFEFYLKPKQFLDAKVTITIPLESGYKDYEIIVPNVNEINISELIK